MSTLNLCPDARLPLVAGLLLALSGCQTAEKLLTPHDQSIIDNYESVSSGTVAEYAAVAQRLPVADQLFQIPRLGAHAAGTAGSFDIVLTPQYAGSLFDLDKRDVAELDQLVDKLRGRAGVTLDIIGHASAVPLRDTNSFADNQALSVKRATTVASYLQQGLALPNEALTVTGRGATEPLVEETSSANQLVNRRVQIRGHYVEPQAEVVAQAQGIPSDFQPWWDPMVTRGLDAQSTTVSDSLEGLYLRTLQHSSQIKVFSDIPLIRETSILEAQGRFDPHAFAEVRYNTVDEPVGSTLRTGGPERFSEQETFGRVGVRDVLPTGGRMELSQRIGGKDNNSVFFVPDEQASTRFNLSFTQPLLNGGGIDYNRSTVAIAMLDSNIAEDEFKRQVESHLLEVSRAYWDLYRARAQLLQKRKLVDNTGSVVQEMTARREVDTLDSEIAKAQAALAMREAEGIRAELAVRNAQSRIAALVNDPQLIGGDRFEFVPAAAPKLTPVSLSERDGFERALENRPEISQVIKQAKAAAIRVDMSRRELLPVLDLVIETYWDGLTRDYAVGRALNNQFSDGGPSAGIGLLFDMPLGNREAKARNERRRLEARQLGNQLRTTIDTIMLEVQVAVREINTAQRDAIAKYHALAAADKELKTLLARRDVDAGALKWTGVYLNDVLAAQERQTAAEQEYTLSVVTYNVALRNFDRATGTLMQTQRIASRRQESDGLPSLILEKQP